MTETQIRPRIETEVLPAPRLEQALVTLPVEPPEPVSSAALGLAGATVLAVGLGGVWCAGFVQDQFARGVVAGWVTLAVALLGFGLVGAGILRELRALFALSGVDRLRRDFASGDLRRMRRAAHRWVDGLGLAELRPALDAADTPEAVLALLRAGPQASLRLRADALARTAALQMGAAVAVTPSPALDVAVMGWRGVRLVRQVAELHGMRPGLLGTLALLRRTAVAAVTVAATELAVNAAAHAVLTNPLLEHVLGDMAGAGIAARRMLLLGRAAEAACSPVVLR